MLYVIRHGKTDWNCRYKLQGNTDIQLNEEGREMARAAAAEYADVHFDVCYCSPLGRARETAAILLEGRGVPVIYDERLREIRFGRYEGTEQVFKHPESPIYNFFKDPEHYVAPETAEPLQDLVARAGSFYEEIAKPQLDEGKDILIVGHGALNSAMIAYVKKLPMSELWSTGIPNCRLIHVETL